MDEQLPLLERVDLARVAYAQLTGKLPTRCVLTTDDMIELAILIFHRDEFKGIARPPMTNELEVYGMRLRVEPFAKTLRVYFQES